MAAQSKAAAIPHQDEPGEVVQVFDEVEILFILLRQRFSYLKSAHYFSVFEALHFLSTLTYSL